MNLKNIFIFYIFIIIPFGTIFILFRQNLVSSNIFILSLLIYALIYRPLLSGIRLIQSGKINKKQLWHKYIPGWNSRFFFFLYFGSSK